LTEQGQHSGGGWSLGVGATEQGQHSGGGWSLGVGATEQGQHSGGGWSLGVVLENPIETASAARIVTRNTFFIVSVSPFFWAEFIQPMVRVSSLAFVWKAPGPSIPAVQYHQGNECIGVLRFFSSET
jgi:hypothetical protein